MKNNKFHPILIFVLLAIIIVTGCGMQAPAELEESSEPQNADSKPVPVTEAPTVVETEASLEEPAPTEAPAEEAPVSTISFATDVLPIIESRCVNCHGGKRVEEGLYLRTYDEILAGSDHGAVVIPGDVEGSLLVELVANQEMPKRGPKLTPAQIQIISDWVAAGAANN